MTLSQLPILLSVGETTATIHRIFEAKNVVTIWFHRQHEGEHNGSANEQLLNPYIYRKFLNKTFPIGRHFMEIAPHRKSLEGSNPPSAAQIQKWGFNNMNSALATVTAN